MYTLLIHKKTVGRELWRNKRAPPPGRLSHKKDSQKKVSSRITKRGGGENAPEIAIKKKIKKRKEKRTTNVKGAWTKVVEPLKIIVPSLINSFLFLFLENLRNHILCQATRMRVQKPINQRKKIHSFIFDGSPYLKERDGQMAFLTLEGGGMTASLTWRSGVDWRPPLPEGVGWTDGLPYL